ncbi:hypothetical protein EXIGLDRAFT_730814 [Exidia glandulosa HHB12029]|uniref:Cupredoxin n=1 Tax=Exidia glandulosa HHB12029 TaxID=1314781 RepID=A0A165C1S7_EXIGL|nr:hypothetical protein EXIGLDRAFT_730814 [Exidia glandulosa HHB12029]
MRFTSFALAAALGASTSFVSATDIQVTVGADGQKAFVPNSVTAAVGDTIVFTFKGANHTVTQSTFAQPCSPLAGGANSGFQPVLNGPEHVLRMNITDASAPIWMFCAQPGHCENAGMVFAVNAPTEGNTFDKYKANALALGTGATSGAPPTTSAPASVPAPAPPQAGAGSSSTPKQIPVVVGADGQLQFSPSSTTANIGDEIVFMFGAAGNHSATQSTFGAPCTPKPNGFDSGFGNKQAISKTFKVTTTDPQWFYCAQTSPAVHCQKGMVFSLNAPASGNTADAFQKAAIATAGGATAATPPTTGAPASAPPATGGTVPAAGPPADGTAAPPVVSAPDAGATAPTTGTTVAAPGPDSAATGATGTTSTVGAAATGGAAVPPSAGGAGTSTTTTNSMTVIVGANGQLEFSPPSAKVAKGGSVTFVFGAAGNHSVTQSTFGAPCTPKASGFDTGFNNKLAVNKTFPVTDDTTPLWFFCAQTAPKSHCQSGMVFSLNAPDTGNTADAFMKAAMNTSNTPTTPTDNTTPGSNAFTVKAGAAVWAPALLALALGML